MRADESVRPAQASDILAASSVAAEPLVNFLKGPWVINPRDKVTGVLHPPRLPSGPTGVKRIPYGRNTASPPMVKASIPITANNITNIRPSSARLRNASVTFRYSKELAVVPPLFMPVQWHAS